MFEEYRARMLKFVNKADLAMFELFLRENDLFDKFEANCLIRNEMDITHASELLANGFKWDSSPEKLNFWLIASLKWEELYASRR